MQPVCARCGIPQTIPCPECGLATGESILAVVEPPSRAALYAAGGMSFVTAAIIIGATLVAVQRGVMSFEGEGLASAVLLLPPVVCLLLGWMIVRAQQWAAIAAIPTQGLCLFLMIGAGQGVDKAGAPGWLAAGFQVSALTMGLAAALAIACLAPIGRLNNHRRWLLWQASKPRR